MNFSRHKREPFNPSKPRGITDRRRHSAFRLSLRQKKEDGGAFRQDFPIIQLQGRYRPLGIDAIEISAGFSLVRCKIHALQIKVYPSLKGRDMGGHGTGAGGIVKFHVALPADHGGFLTVGTAGCGAPTYFRDIFLMTVQHWVNRVTHHLWYDKSSASPLLAPLGRAYGQGVGLVHEAYRSGRIKTLVLPVPVIVVGNITVGGTGKTPLTIWMAQMLKQQGLRPGIISRGYGGITPRRPLDVTFNTSPRLAGDEPVMMARKTGCPVSVFPRRVDAAYSLINRYNVDVIIADDGLQHHELGRDIEIAVVDGSRGFGNGHLLPAGPLREPVERLASVDFIISNGKGETDGLVMQLQPGRITNLRQRCMKRSVEAFDGETVHAVAGIGNPDRFFQSLKRQGLKIEPHAFPDHHAYTRRDFDFAKDDPIIMTEKDAIKCQAFASENLWYQPVEAVLPAEFPSLLMKTLREKFNART